MRSASRLRSPCREHHLAMTQFLRGLSFSHGRDDHWEFTMLYRSPNVSSMRSLRLSAGLFERAGFHAAPRCEDLTRTVMSLDAVRLRRPLR